MFRYNKGMRRTGITEVIFSLVIEPCIAFAFTNTDLGSEESILRIGSQRTVKLDHCLIFMFNGSS